LHFKGPTRIPNITTQSWHFIIIFEIVVWECIELLKQFLSGHRKSLSIVYGYLFIYLTNKFVNESGHHLGACYFSLIKIVRSSTHFNKSKFQVKNVSYEGKITKCANVLFNQRNKGSQFLPKKNKKGLNLVVLRRHNFSMLNNNFNSNTSKSSERVSITTAKKFLK
jgi:hypothetical protein